MEDQYKDDPNSWLRRIRFPKTVYHHPVPSQMPVIPVAKLKHWYAELNSKGAATSMPVTGDNTSKAIESTTMPTLKSNPDNSLSMASEAQEGSDSKATKTEPASKHKVIPDMFKRGRENCQEVICGPTTQRGKSEVAHSRSTLIGGAPGERPGGIL